MVHKDANETLSAFKKMLEHNLNLHTPRVQEKMRQKNLYDYPVVILSDEGSEFSKQFEDFLRVHGIKKRTTESYTPQPNVEATNNVLRNLLRAQFIKSGTLHWKSHLEDLMRSKNSNRDLVTGQFPYDVLVEYLQSLYIKDEERKLRRTQRLRKAHERRREHTKRLEGRLRKFRGQLLREGDHVRVRLANFQSGVRQQIKMGNRKQIVIRFSPEIYVVKGVIDRSVNKLYTLATQDGDAILNPNGKTRVFQRNDLLKVPTNTPKTAFTLKKVNRLNRLKSKGDTVRELYIQPIVNKTRKRRRKRRVKKVKDVSEWGAPEWRALLQGKEFTDDDDGIRRVITDVVFSHEDDVYYARYVIKGEKDIKKNHDYTILRQVFDMAREGGDDWVEDRFYKGKKIE